MEKNIPFRYRQYYKDLGPFLKKTHVRAYAMAAFSLFVVSFFAAFFIRPAVTQIFEINRKIDDRRLVSQKLDEKIKNLEKAKSEYQKVQEDLPFILTALPQDANFTPLLRNLEEMASSSAISLTNLGFQNIDLLKKNATKSAQPGKSLTTANFLAFDLSASGSYPTFFSFLETIKKGGRLVNIDTISFAPEEETESTPSGQLEMVLKNEAYFLYNALEEDSE